MPENSTIRTLVAGSMLALKTTVGAKLGAPLDWVELIREQLSAAVIDSITQATGLSQAEIIRSLGLVERTIVRRKTGGELLTQDETEKIVRLARAIERACQVLGKNDAGLDWLQSTNSSLGGNRPLDLLDTDIGAQLVLDTLGRIEHGVFA